MRRVLHQVGLELPSGVVSILFPPGAAVQSAAEQRIQSRPIAP